MQPHHKVLTVLVVAVVTVLAAVLLNLTAGTPDQTLAGGNTTAATQTPFSAAKGVEPTSFYRPAGHFAGRAARDSAALRADQRRS
ncbi:MAG: hypothetical protein V9G10_07700 [Candidatus Nanopelagicales bacterium]